MSDTEVIASHSRVVRSRTLPSPLPTHELVFHKVLLTWSKGEGSAMAFAKARPFASQVDEITRISVAGLFGKQRVTLRTKITGDKGERFESFAHYIADEQGSVCVSSQPSVGGSYTGVEPMGLMWSMKLSPGQRDGIRLMKKDVTKPYIVNLDVFDGHLRLGGEQKSVGEPLTSATFEKSYMKAGVRRIPVREGRVRGALFLPPGDGPFPGRCNFSYFLGLQFMGKDRWWCWRWGWGGGGGGGLGHKLLKPTHLVVSHYDILKSG